MKNLKLTAFAVLATLVLGACQGSNNTPTPVSPTACNTGYNPYATNNQYGYGQTGYPGCVSPSAYNSPYGYNSGYNNYGGNNSNPCAIYYQQYGVMYYPANVGGQIMCVASQ